MNVRKIFVLLLIAVPLATAAGLAARDARGDAEADKALAEAVKRGKALFEKSWSSGSKGCFACHTRGPNKMTATRAESYPKFDKGLGKVVTVQQKINDMIKTKSMGEQLTLGSDDMNALEAYLETLK